jgi:signal transduction histidine kinase/CheY-like chemotaxis protein
MIVARIPDNEKERLQALLSYEILDTAPEVQFEEITRLAADYCDTPIALVSLIDESRQWFKSHYGLEASETHRDQAFCSHVILGQETMVVNDTLKDERFVDNGLVTNPPYIRFYAGTPLTTPDDYNIGTLCVIDKKARTLNEKQKFALEIMARIVMKELELRKSLNEQTKIEKQLRDAKQAAEDANAAKSEFLSIVSHEIRTPLNAILGISYLLLEEEPKPDQIENLSTLKVSTESLLNLVNDLLDFSKIEAGKLILEKTRFSLHETMENIVKILSVKASDKGVDLNFNYDNDLPIKFIGDPTRLSQIITNLLSNALKFTNKGEVLLTLKQIETSSSKAKIQFSVKDTGIGLTRQQGERIFESFTQAEGETTRKYGGTGLGLSITKKLINIMGSEIYVASEVGQGSNFFFTLDLEIDNQKQPPHNSAPKIEPYQLTGLKLLLVEDNEINTIIMKKFMTKWGIEPDIAINGIEALKLVESKEYDMIIMDLQMPEMDGYEATRMIRKMTTHNAKTPIIALTASSESDVIEETIKAGMNDVVTKPFNPAKLKEKIQHHLSQSNNGA